MNVFIETIGCKLNQFESQALSENLKKEGFAISEKIENSEYVIVNTCSVTNKADVKSRLVMKKARKLGKKVVVTGCYATTDFEELKNSDYADIVVKNDSKFRIPEYLKSHRLLEENASNALKEEFPLVHQFDQTRAFIKIQDGCDKFCSYCKIPHARGRSRSLDPEKVIGFVGELQLSGYKEFVLTGINISDYNKNRHKLYDLVGRILDLPGNFRLRLSSLQPDEFDPRMAEWLTHPKFANHFHLSLQSGSSSVLKRMERNYDRDFFIEICDRIRSVSPDAGLSTDLIVGFPGETDQEFQETLDTVRKARFSRVHIFPYSPRSHTKASRMVDIPPNIKKERTIALEKLSLETALNFAQNHILGKEQIVLTEKQDKKGWFGHTSNYFKIALQGQYPENEFIRIKPGQAFVSKGAVELGV